MQRDTLSELARRCQKPDHDRIGTWMARRVSRPAALRITRIVAPWGVSAGMATLAAWGCGVAAAAAMAFGSPGAWLAGALLLQTWYLLDHVDGQLARLRGTSSLDGAQLDYLMHHTINLLVPLGLGYGVAARQNAPGWLLAGLTFGLGLLLIGLEHDARYKAFVVRLKRLDGRLLVEGGAGGRPEPPPPVPREPRRLATWVLRKACEIHVMMNVVSVLALVQWLLGDGSLLAGRIYLGLMAPAAILMAVATIARGQRNAATEQEFGRWFRVPPGHDLTYEEGWWFVRPAKDARCEGGDEPAEAAGHPTFRHTR
jgi:phosphatidylglycerophosphate synthase